MFHVSITILWGKRQISYHPAKVHLEISTINSSHWIDVLEIQTLVARIAQSVDSAHNVSDLMNLLTVDVELKFGTLGREDSSTDPIIGAKAWEEWVISRRVSLKQGPKSGTKHVVTTVVVDVIDEDTAQARSYFTFYRHKGETTEINALGTYNDSFVRTNGTWLLSRRHIGK